MSIKGNKILSSVFTFKNIYLFGIGLFSAFFIRILGSITIAELLILALFLFLFLRGDIQPCAKNKDLKNYTLLLFLAAFSCIISSILSKADSQNMHKGIFTILLLIPGLYVFFWLLHSKPSNIIYYLIGAILSGILVNNYFRDFSDLLVNQRSMSFEDMEEVQWAGLYSPYFLFAIAIFYKRFPIITACSMILMAIFLLYGFSRSSFLIFFISAIILIVINQFKISEITKKINKYKFVFLIVAVIGVWGAGETYSYMAKTGILGERAQNKYLLQAESKLGIASGRVDTFRGLITIFYHPIIGVGFMGEEENYEDIINDMNNIFGTQEDYNKIKGAHSAMLDWWIYFGILAVPFWIYALLQCYLSITKYTWTYPPLSAYLTVSILSLIWNIFASPFGYRINYEIILVLMLLIKPNVINQQKYLLYEYSKKRECENIHHCSIV